jgi:hypothetical protein
MGKGDRMNEQRASILIFTFFLLPFALLFFPKYPEHAERNGRIEGKS